MINDYVDDVPVDEITSYIEGLWKYTAENNADVLRAIANDPSLNESNEQLMRRAIEAYNRSRK